jgi:high-affinity iron transporter
MLLSSVIFTLQETLEAALIISVLLVTSRLVNANGKYIGQGILIGLAGALIYSLNMATISEWFDYVGQEITNATIQFLIIIFIISLTYLTFNLIHQKNNSSVTIRTLFAISVTAIIALAITREGSEILIFFGGFYQQSNDFTAVIMGGAIGFTIGVSVGILLYYLLMNIATIWRQRISTILLALTAGNMASQAVTELTQADWMSQGQFLWDTSTLLSEYSVLGQLMYALIGYEATPSSQQVIFYLVAISLVIASYQFSNRSRQITLQQQ